MFYLWQQIIYFCLSVYSTLLSESFLRKGTFTKWHIEFSVKKTVDECKLFYVMKWSCLTENTLLAETGKLGHRLMMVSWGSILFNSR